MRMPYAVSGEDNVRGLQQTGAEHVGEGVVFLVESENCSGGETW
jgi:hypothetical protein